MRRVLSLGFLAIALLIASLGAAIAQDWNGKWVTTGANVTNYLDLRQTGTAIQGTVSGYDKGTLAGTANGAALTGTLTFANGATLGVTGSLQNDVIQLTLATNTGPTAVTLVRDTRVIAPPIAATQYYYLDPANARFGPFDLTGMQGAIGAGSIKPETLVWSAGMAGWERADAVPAIAALLAAPVNEETVVEADPNWEYYLSDGEGNPVGPFKLADLRAKAANGELFSWSRVWRSDRDLWMRADRPPELRPFFVPARAAAISNETVTIPAFTPNLAPDQSRKVQIVLGATLGILMHELAHALIGELGVPVTGPEEDSADEFSALFLSTAFRPDQMPGEDPAVIAFLQNMVRYATVMWKHVDDAHTTNNDPAKPWWDAHSVAGDRFRNMLCLVYGSSPETYTELADSVDFPPSERELCKLDYPRHLKAWELITASFLREQGDGKTGYQPADTPGGKVTVEFRPSITATGQALLPVLEQSQMFQGIGDVLEKNFIWPRDFTILFADCGEPNAFYSPDDIHVIMCWEGLEYFTGALLDGERVARH